MKPPTSGGRGLWPQLYEEMLEQLEAAEELGLVAREVMPHFEDSVVPSPRSRDTLTSVTPERGRRGRCFTAGATRLRDR